MMLIMVNPLYPLVKSIPSVLSFGKTSTIDSSLDLLHIHIQYCFSFSHTVVSLVVPIFGIIQLI